MVSAADTDGKVRALLIGPPVLTVMCCGRMQENTRPVCVAAGLAVVRVSSLRKQANPANG